MNTKYLANEAFICNPESPDQPDDFPEIARITAPWGEPPLCCAYEDEQLRGYIFAAPRGCFEAFDANHRYLGAFRCERDALDGIVPSPTRRKPPQPVTWKNLGPARRSKRAV
jgi:hypothetical protein